MVDIYNVTYDARNRLTQQKWIVPGSGVSYVSSTTYNARGQVVEQRLDTGSNGLTRQYVYDQSTMRLTTMRAGVSSPYTNLQNLSYSYDAVGNIASLVDGVNSNQRQCFQYDALDRLTNAFTGNAGCTAYATGGTGPYNHTYAYNAIGNLTSYAGNAYTYGDSAHKHAVTGAYGNSYGYDGNGNQTTRTIAGTTYTLVFDYENRLTEVKQGATSLATFLYDADGNRVKGTVSGVTTVYVAGIYEYQAGATTKYYEGGGLRRTGYSTNNGVFYMLGDHLKSTSALVARDGVLNVKYFYYPYGAQRGVPFNSITAKHFTGQYHETSLPGGEGLYFYNARWYDPKLGVFLSADSIVPNPGDPQSFNRYAYVGGNPLRISDPSGHTKLCDAACEDAYKWSPPTKKGGGTSSGSVTGAGGGQVGGFVGGGGGGSYFGNAQGQHRVSMWSYWSSSQSGDDLVSDWFNERGGTMRVYGPQAAMTRDLRRDEGVQAARVAYYRQPVKDFFYPYHFNQPIQPIREELQYRFGLHASGVGRVLGGYTVYVQAIGAEQGTSELLFVVYNVMSRESGTRLLGRGPSIESYLLGERPSNPQTARDYWPKSILENRSRQETHLSVIPPRLSGWGGSITTIFVWSEPVQVMGEQ